MHLERIAAQGIAELALDDRPPHTVLHQVEHAARSLNVRLARRASAQDALQPPCACHRHAKCRAQAPRPSEPQRSGPGWCRGCFSLLRLRRTRRRAGRHATCCQRPVASWCCIAGARVARLHSPLRLLRLLLRLGRLALRPALGGRCLARRHSVRTLAAVTGLPGVCASRRAFRPASVCADTRQPGLGRGWGRRGARRRDGDSGRDACPQDGLPCGRARRSGQPRPPRRAPATHGAPPRQGRRAPLGPSPQPRPGPPRRSACARQAPVSRIHQAHT